MKRILLLAFGVLVALPALSQITISKKQYDSLLTTTKALDSIANGLVGAIEAFPANSIPCECDSVPPLPPTPNPIPEDAYESILNNDDSRATYVGVWSYFQKAGMIKNDGKYSGTAGDYMQATVNCLGFSLVSEKFPHHGKAKLFVDGVEVATIDFYSSVGKELQTVYTSGELPEQDHVIKLLILGEHNSNSTGNDVVFDALKVYNANAPPEPPVGTYTYYVAPNGNDGGPGTKAEPFKTGNKAASVATNGQTVAFRQGTYRETITPLNDGVTFTSYPGEVALISGLNPVTSNWTPHSGKIYKTTITFPSRNAIGFGSANQADQANEAVTNENLQDYQLFDDGVMQIEARWPKGVKEFPDYLKLSATGDGNRPADTDTRRHTSDMIAFDVTRIVDNALLTSNGFPIPSGGLVGAWMNDNGWFIAESRQITAHNGNTINWNGNIWNDTKVRKYYFLTGKLGFLTQAREFHHENNTLYFWAADGNVPTNVEYKARNWGFNLKGRSNITIKNLSFLGCEPVQGNPSTNDVVVDNIRARHTNHSVIHRRTYWQGYGNSQLAGTKLVGQRNIIKNSELDWGGSQGVWIGASGLVENNLIQHYGYDGMWGCGVAHWGEQNIDNIKILRNTIAHMGRGCVDNGYAFSEQDVGRSTRNNEIAYNDFSDFAKLNQDGGAFYSWGWQNLSGTRHHHNRTHDDGAVPSPVPLANGAGGDGIMAAWYYDMGSGANIGQPPHTNDHNLVYRIGTATGWVDNDWGDVYTQPAFVQNTPGYPDYQDRGPKQPGLYYNNTFAGDRKSYVTYQNATVDVHRNNIFLGEVNNNWGGNPGNVANSVLQQTNPGFVGGDISKPELYFQLSPTSPARGLGTSVSVNGDDTGPKDAGAFYADQVAWTAGYKAVPQQQAPPEQHSSNTALIAAIIILAVVVVALIIFILYKRRKP